MELPKKGEIVSLEEIKEITDHFELYKLWDLIENDPPSKPFSSDGCSFWFDKWNNISMYPACFVHDLYYWSGYKGDRIARLHADIRLMEDVVGLLGVTDVTEEFKDPPLSRLQEDLDLPESIDGVTMAELMFFGVRRAGGPFWGRKHSWGFGRQ